MDETIPVTNQDVAGAPSEPASTEYQDTYPESVYETSETVGVVIDYTPVIYDAASALANVFLAGALMILGCLVAFKLWEVPHK